MNSKTSRSIRYADAYRVAGDPTPLPPAAAPPPARPKPRQREIEFPVKRPKGPQS